MKFKRNVFTLIFIVLFVVICCKSQMKKLVKGETLTPELSIVSYNISYSDSVYLMAAVSYNNIDYTANPIKLLFWDAEQTEYTVNNASYQSSAVASKIVKNQECLIYYSKGIAAREMADVIYMRAYVEIDGVEYYSDLITYSVVQYVKDRITNSNCTEAQLNMYKAMLDYGTAAQILLDYNTENLANEVINRKNVNRSINVSTDLSVISCNISYSDSVYLMAAVSYNNIDYTANPIKLLFWDAEQTEYTVNNASYQSSAVASKIVKNQECLIYYSKGIAAREMADVIYMRAYVEIDGVEYYSDLITYSVVQYVKDRITNSNCTEAQLNMYKAMLDYGTAAQILLNNNTENLANADFAMISVKNGTLPNGTNMYMYLNNQTIKVTANDIENKEFLYWQDGEGNIVSYEKEYEFVINGNAFLEAVYAEIIDIYVDTINLNVTQNNDLSWCNITCENSNDLVYIIITVTINDDIYKNSFYKLIVNGKEVSASKLQISEDEIVYKMDDPNWSDFV